MRNTAWKKVEGYLELILCCWLSSEQVFVLNDPKLVAPWEPELLNWRPSQPTRYTYTVWPDLAIACLNTLSVLCVHYSPSPTLPPGPPLQLQLPPSPSSNLSCFSIGWPQGKLWRVPVIFWGRLGWWVTNCWFWNSPAHCWFPPGICFWNPNFKGKQHLKFLS